MKRYLLLYSLIAALFLSGAPGLSAAGLAESPANTIHGDIARQQPDPKKKEITATVARSIEAETLMMNTYFPEDASQVRVALYNILGKLIQVHPVTSAEKGDYSFRFLTRGLPSGPYILILETSGQRIVHKVMLSR